MIYLLDVNVLMQLPGELGAIGEVLRPFSFQLFASFHGLLEKSNRIKPVQHP